MSMFVRKSAGRLESGWCIFISSLISLCFLWSECVFTPLQLQKASEQRCQTVCVSEWRKGFLRQLIVGHDRSNDASQVRFVITAHNWHIWCVCWCDIVQLSNSDVYFGGARKKREENPHESTKSFIVGICVHIQRTQDCIFKKNHLFFNIWQKLEWEK